VDRSVRQARRFIDPGHANGAPRRASDGAPEAGGRPPPITRSRMDETAVRFTLSRPATTGRGAANAREEAMPFDGIDNPIAAKSLHTLELMEDRLQGGRKWTRHFMYVDGGKMCLLGAHYFGCYFGDGMQADRALDYLAQAIKPTSNAASRSDRCWIETTITGFNDRCAGYGEIERVLHHAQELARAEIASARSHGTAARNVRRGVHQS
jgi:hypothetical protein